MTRTTHKLETELIVTFRTKPHGDITYLGDVALELLRIMGRSDTIPSAMYAEDIPEALAKLKSAVEADESSCGVEEAVDERGEDSEAAISLQHRVLPLIQLLEAAHEANSPVSWDS